MREVRIGLVGCGFMGRLHAEALVQDRGAVLAAVFDTDREAADRLGSELDVRVCDSLDELLSQSGLQGVVIATPDHAHRGAVIAAARSNLAVLVEKPLATDLEDADEMIRACEEAGVMLMVGHILRFETVYANLCLAVREGVIGEIVSVFARRHGLRAEAERFGHSGHVVDYLGVHDFDILNWLRPQRPVSIESVAARRSIYERFGTPDVVVSTLTYADGSVAVVESGWTLPQTWGESRAPEAWSPFGDVRLDVFGEEGVLSLDLRTMNLLGVDDKGWRMPETRHWPRLHGRITGALREEIEHFLSCLTSEAVPLSSGRSARDAVVLCRASHRSLEARARVEIGEFEVGSR